MMMMMGAWMETRRTQMEMGIMSTDNIVESVILIPSGKSLQSGGIFFHTEFWRGFVFFHIWRQSE